MQVVATNLPEVEQPIYTNDVAFYPPAPSSDAREGDFIDLLKRIAERVSREQETSGVVHAGVVGRSG